MRRLLPILSLFLLALLAPRAGAVIGGHETPIEKYPWHVDMLACGGTLIAPDRALTAAHCLTGIERTGEIRLTVGERFESGRKRLVRRHARHPDYRSVDGLLGRYDIAVLELAEPVAGVTPLPVAKTAARPGERLHLLGRGLRRWFGLDTDKWPKRFRRKDRDLVIAPNVAISDAACKRYYATNRYKRDYFAAEDMTCSLDPGKRASKAPGATWISVCAGDSGGPLLRRRPGGGFEQVGITSWSEWCGIRHDPSVFMRPEAINAFLANPLWAPLAKGKSTTVRSGDEVRCVPPEFEGEVTKLTYRWARPDGASVKLAGETVRTGEQVVCSVVAENAGGATSA